MKKLYIMLIVLTITLLNSCGNNTWVLDKSRLEDEDIQLYAEQLQSEYAGLKGYRIFTISEGKKMVVVSSGETNQTLSFVKAETTNDKTTITVEEKSEETEEKNPFILIGIDKIKGELSVINENGGRYDEI